ncbi:MAG TPA: asparagine--tRNA ligase [Clostridiaceae bacterium]
MAEYIKIRQMKDFIGKEVVIKGWLAGKRSSGKIAFLQLRDGSGFIQAVLEKSSTSEEKFLKVKEITQESSIEVTGIVKEEEKAPMGFELTILDFKIMSLSLDYPITNKEHGTDFLMDERHLWIRHRRPFATLKIRSRITKAARDFFDNRGFTLIESPIITPSSCEGTSNLFKIDYFGNEAYLSQTGQLYAEAAAMAFGLVYTFGPTFRAEKSKTRRHLNEFWMLEPEMAFFTHEDNLVLQEELIEYIVTEVLNNCTYELKLLNRDLEELKKIKAPFPRLRYSEAIELLKEKGFEDIQWGDDFGAPHEIFLSEQFEGKPVFITHYPKAIKAFYMEIDDVDPRCVKCADLLYPGFGEIIGGSERINNLEVLEERIKEEKLPEGIYDWYVDLRKYGTVPHSGFGLGIERLVSVITGIEHIREAITFPRTLTRMKP